MVETNENNKITKWYEIYDKLLKFENGERVAQTMIEIWKYSLDPLSSHMISSCKQLLEKIVYYEEKLSNRSYIEIYRKGSVLDPFLCSLYELSSEDACQIEKIMSVEIRDTITSAVLEFPSSRGDENRFQKWVMGGELDFDNTETLLTKAQLGI